MKNTPKFYELFYIFLFGSIFGYIIEVLWSYYRFRIFINHSALVIGPFNIVYGITATIFSYILYRFRRDNIFKIFIISFIVGTIAEYLLSLSMELLLGFTAWNYKRYFLNINGRVCLKYSIFWGILGVIWIKLLFNKILIIINKIPKRIGKYLMYILIIFLIFDSFLTLSAVNRAKNKEQGIEAKNSYERFLDNHYNKDYLNNMYNRRWNKK